LFKLARFVPLIIYGGVLQKTWPEVEALMDEGGGSEYGGRRSGGGGLRRKRVLLLV
jgi:hypothetical protein